LEDIELMHFDTCAVDGSTANLIDKVTLFEGSGSTRCYLSYQRIKRNLHSRVGKIDVRKSIICFIAKVIFSYNVPSSYCHRAVSNFDLFSNPSGARISTLPEKILKAVRELSLVVVYPQKSCHKQIAVIPVFGILLITNLMVG